ncbi:iron-sulfur cluster carrier protein ApbC [Pleionea sp. CnH1-48]|uniref:iron-sulfur cluster carrier protein ApbC n=1 Tax=Pleionea sp. CnH1-48 TaxID=2954494 RepID=UPI00209724C4|nr:iron-sulfur cluster carrier protein ApbC [Pleionea sp. CnH1-48]MCO7222917.1 iron-sulfur cluster carrier protein ApbC [Pleionea sp. CnH1-48]
MTIQQNDVKAQLAQIVLPELGQDLVSSNWVKSIEVDANQVKVRLVAGFPCSKAATDICQGIEQQLQTALSAESVSVELDWQVHSHSHKAGVNALPEVKNIIAIASGKGGVGKSTTTVNMALALAAEGASVGILDADIYGPSQPIMLGREGERPETLDQKRILPVENYGIQSMSIGYLIEPEQAMVWRGPMASGALQQLLNDTQWKGLDYLLVDLPPGTGDIQLTLAQKVPLTAAVIVTTPQDIALADAVKGIAMFEKVSVPVLGVVENMGVHVCSNCGHAEHIFGAGGGEALAQEKNMVFLGSLPLAKSIRDHADKGEPTVIAEPDGAIADSYRQIARKMAARLSQQSKDFGQSFPTISISND